MLLRLRALLALALAVLASASTLTPPRRLRYGIVGTGCIGLEHIRNLHLVDEAELVAIADPHAPSIEAARAVLSELSIDEAGVAICAGYEELLALPQVDAVVVCTPNDHHIHVLRAALPTGKHCLVEKPLCTEVAHCAEVEALAADAVAAAAAAGRPPPVLWCGMEYRYIPSIARLVGEADAGACGALKMLSVREHRFPFLRKVDNWNRFSARTGGTLVEKCCHFFDLMRRIMHDEPKRIVASGGQDVNHLGETHSTQSKPSATPDILDNAYVVVEWQSGARSLLELCMFAEASKHQEELSLVGTHGKLEAFAPAHGQRTDDPSVINFRRHTRNAAFVDDFDRVEPPAPEECGSSEEAHIGVAAELLQAGNHAGATHEELRRFTDAALDGRPPDVTLSDGTKAVLMGLAAHRSIDEGRPVTWDEMLAEVESARPKMVASEEAMAVPAAAAAP